MSVSHSKRDTVEKLLLSNMLMNATNNNMNATTTNATILKPTTVAQIQLTPQQSPATASTLLFSIEQWELIRRLRNSGLVKEQICQAFDELDRLERDLGGIYDMPVNKMSGGGGNGASSTKQNELFAKNFQLLLSQATLSSNAAAGASTNCATSSSSSSSSNSVAGANKTSILNKSNESNNCSSNTTVANHNDSNSNPSASFSGTSSSTNAAATQNANNLVNAYFANIIDTETENKQIEELRSKGEVVVHSEISFFVYKHDLKQSQIARMAGVNQAYVSKFLRGEFFDLSENGKTLIYRWYLRFLKHSQIYLQAHNITLTSNDHHMSKSIKMEAQENSNPTSTLASNMTIASFTNVTNTSYDQPKRTRFSFKTEHLMILEKAFLENQYPDQKRREEIAKMCNEARPCADREKVTEQIITHWFQNKRKISRKANCEGDQTSPNNNLNSGGSSGGGAGGSHMLSNGSNMPMSYDGEVDYEEASSSNNNDDEDYTSQTYQQNANTNNSASPITYQDDYIDEQPLAPAPHFKAHDSNEDELDNDEEINFDT